MNKKWSSKKVKSVLLWLEKRWPQLFAPGPDRQPLALDIHKEILKFRSECPELSRRTLDEALKRHMTSYGYLYGMSKHSHRVDLSGKQVGLVAENHSAWASQLLRKMQKDAQRARKGRKKPASGNRGKPVFLNKRQSIKSPEMVTGGVASPVIRYKQRRRRTVVPVVEVEMVS